MCCVVYLIDILERLGLSYSCLWVCGFRVVSLSLCRYIYCWTYLILRKPSFPPPFAHNCVWYQGVITYNATENTGVLFFKTYLLLGNILALQSLETNTSGKGEENVCSRNQKLTFKEMFRFYFEKYCIFRSELFIWKMSSKVNWIQWLPPQISKLLYSNATEVLSAIYLEITAPAFPEEAFL